MKLSLTIIRSIRSHFSGPRERGAALVEAAIAIPLLLLVIMGSIEFGFAWEAKSTSTSGVRSGVLRAATLGDNAQTDMQILQAIVGEVGAQNSARIEWVAIYQADVADQQAAIDACVAGGANCAFYDNRTAPGFLNQLSVTTDAEDFRTLNFDDGSNANAVTGDYDCDVAKEDFPWCAGLRFEGGNDVELGVAIQYKHEWFTGIFPFTAPTYQDYAVTSTFLGEGAPITPSIAIPDGVGQVYTNKLGGPTLDGFTGVTDADLNNNPPGVPGIEFLGRFGSETITLTVDTPQEHSKVCISFELYLLGSWDVGTVGPGHTGDTFSVDVNTADGVVEMTEQYDRGDDLGDLGYPAGGWSDEGRMVEIFQCSEHSGPTASINFSAALSHASLDNEAWAIGEVTVTVGN